MSSPQEIPGKGVLGWGGVVVFPLCYRFFHFQVKGISC